jgi:hypothetical protein
VSKGGWSDGVDDGYVTFTAAEFADNFDMVLVGGHLIRFLILAKRARIIRLARPSFAP